MTDDALTDWLRSAAPLGDADPDDVSDDELAPLLDVIGNARVIALGESMHRTHEFLAWRNRLLRFLVEHAGVTAIVLESGFPEAAVVDRWVRSGEGRLRTALDDGVTYHFGKCQETLDLVTWLRARRVSGGSPVAFYGMDIPASAATALPAITEVVDVLDRLDPEYGAHVRRTLLPFFRHLPSDRSGLAWAATAIRSYLDVEEPQRHRLTAGINALAERVRARAVDYLRDGADPDAVARAVRSAEVARGADAFLAAMLDGPTRTWPAANIRDSTMADTVEWILRREQRVLLFAANGHIRRTPYLAPPFVPAPLTTVGAHLAHRLGADYRVIGTTFGAGDAWLHRPSPDDAPGHSTPFVQLLDVADDGTLDALLADARQGSFLVDLATAPPAVDSATGTRNGPEIELADVRASFDAILHVARITPWHTWIDDRGRWA
ncbi:MAG: erythromycin esterase family protein [Microbacterium sp.]|nr:erythromycin esterase family protein [Microbacterium sp.]